MAKKKQFRPSASAGYARVKAERDQAIDLATASGKECLALKETLERLQRANVALYEECTNLDRKCKTGYALKEEAEREAAILRNGNSQHKKRMSTLVSDNKFIARKANARWWWAAVGWTIAIISLAHGVM
ncbi:hypothetical protein [Yersinia phage vB_YenP_ISAO8]|uniref:Uncharacterized protein n=1 Tax=Yersinia phage vB_YenP_ISAO8 TaxID=1675027 RepID=A0A0H4TH99_9CAUD|nr:hypothetical protein AVU16_gp08 [Yersinia phage vB_YenP_ISAO8]AKQ07678.1 hypothetical protein [Yersinia phage vB_YenP_ISAO8]